ncbi:TlpA family protein disulfide reductase [Hyunsoonleella sp. SJ7]|uniref:TlpA family protein disulfide reductase n=1 Tax=Hyunsoonleella aquatilis TaxID=2762758 RepID=A0A923HBP7_9FLAO|nr:TlpA disulfide reductase family protein [Hyunsoonleella aquatilis]MBC3757063.1 TlpA family protein disulfide reductase [Hyunsoonleella aquatilis]
MNKVISILVIAFIFISNIEAQQKVYYKTNSSTTIHSEESYQLLKQHIRKKLSEDGAEVTINESLTDSVVSNDSIIKTMQLDIKRTRHHKGTKRLPEKINTYLNKELPNFNLTTAEGKELNSNDLKGKPTLINLWLTRCKPCVEEIPVLNELSKKYADKVNFVTITPDRKETTLEFLKNQPFHFIHLTDARAYLEKIGNSSYPKNLFIDKNGVVKKITRGLPHFKKNGKMELGNGEIFEKYILKLLE